MKSYLRFSRASGSTRQRVELAIRRGWRPGLKIGDLLSRKSQRRLTAAGGVRE